MSFKNTVVDQLPEPAASKMALMFSKLWRVCSATVAGIWPSLGLMGSCRGKKATCLDGLCIGADGSRGLRGVYGLFVLVAVRRISLLVLFDSEIHKTLAEMFAHQARPICQPIS